VSWDVILYDDHNAWSPQLNGAGRNGQGVGGFEVQCVQIAHWLAGRGCEVRAMNPGYGPQTWIDGVQYRGIEPAVMQCKALIVSRWSRVPEWIEADTVIVSNVDAEVDKFEHHLGRTMACLSEWHAGLFRAKGHTCEVIPSMIDDWIYELKVPTEKRGYVCVNAWNKGTDATLRLWKELRLPGTLSVGSPYGAPEDAAVRCRAAGATWLGQLSPRQVVAALSRAEAVFRVCERPETFGICDAIAEVVGTPVYGLLPNGFGASGDVLRSSYLTSKVETLRTWLSIARPAYRSTTYRPDYRVSTIMPQWEQVLGLKGGNNASE
jgi:hypothetical protein